jgi:hypothetical protein
LQLLLSLFPDNISAIANGRLGRNNGHRLGAAAGQMAV